MPRHQPEDQALSATQRVQRFRARRPGRRLEVLLDFTSYDQVTRFAQRWGYSRQEILAMAWRACLPAMKQAGTAAELFDRVRSALEAAGIR